MLTLCGQTFERRLDRFRRRRHAHGGMAARRQSRWAKSRCWRWTARSLTQTAPILLQLAEQYGKFGGETAEEKFELLRWLFWDNHKLTGYMATYRFMRTFTPSADPQVLKFLAGGSTISSAFSSSICRTNAFAIGARPSVADFSMMAYLHYPADEHGYDFAASHPAINAWLGRIAALPGWKSAYDLLPGKRLTHYA